jgi:hypothetical protein
MVVCSESVWIKDYERPHSQTHSLGTGALLSGYISRAGARLLRIEMGEPSLLEGLQICLETCFYLIEPKLSPYTVPVGINRIRR